MLTHRTTRYPVAVLAAAICALAVAPGAIAWAWPADGPVLREFSLGEDPYAAGQHRGIDIGIVGARKVRAPSDGEITFARSVATTSWSVEHAAPGREKTPYTHH